MKTRLGFVSNSSSVSFLVVVKKLATCDKCGRSDPNFLDYLDSLGNKDEYETTRLRARGVKEITPKFEKYKDGSWEDRIKRLAEAEEKGYETAYIEVCYHDQHTNDMLNDFRVRGAVQIVWDDHGGDHTIRL